MTQETNSPGHIRARRFPLRLRIRYRGAGAVEWHAGETENISCSGILFRCRHRLQQSAGVEVVLQLPAQISGEAEVDVLCGGYVTRIVTPTLPLARIALAVAFVDFRLLYRNGRPEVSARQSQRAGAARPGSEMAHKLNDQFAVVLGNCELLLQRSDLTGQVRQGLQRIRESTERAVALLREG